MDWNARFAGSDFVFGRAPSQFVTRLEPMLPRAARVLCIADGEGRNSVHLARMGHRVDANDFAANAIAKATALAADAGVEVNFEEVDLSDWTWPRNAYDAVFAVFVQFALPGLRDRMFAGMKQAVVPGGQIYLHGYTPKQLDYRTGGPSDIERLYTEQMLREAFADCEIELLTSYERELHEGAGHSGLSALVDLVARTRTTTA